MAEPSGGGIRGDIAKRIDLLRKKKNAVLRQNEADSRSLEKKLGYYLQGMKREPSVDELDTAIRLHKLSWKEYCNKMADLTRKEIEEQKIMEKRLQRMQEKEPAYEEADQILEKSSKLFPKRYSGNLVKKPSLNFPVKKQQVVMPGSQIVVKNTNKTIEEPHEPTETGEEKSLWYSGNDYKERLPPQIENEYVQKRSWVPGLYSRKRVQKPPFNNKPHEPTESDYYNSSVYGKREPELVTIARKIESEENRMPRALAWAKKEIDNMARKEADKIKNNSVGYLERLENQLDLKRKGKVVETESRLMESLKKKQEDLSEKVLKNKDVKSASVTVYNTQIEKISRDMDQANQRLIAAQKEFEDAQKTYTQYANSKMAQDRESAKEIIKGIVSQVHSRACEKFGIKNPYNRGELRRSLEDFGESEAAHMAENEYKTIYSGWGRIRKYAGSASGYYKSAAGGAARVNDLIDKISDGVKVLLFGPMVIGAAIMMSAAWILETYGAESSSPLFIVFFFITIFAFAMLEIGRAWKG